MKTITCLGLALSIAATVVTPAAAEEYLNGIEWKEPAVVTPGENGGPPSDAAVLFNGKDLSAWEGAESGVAVACCSAVRTLLGER